MALDCFRRVLRNLARSIENAPPLDRRGQTGIIFFYGLGDLADMRHRLHKVLAKLPRSRVVVDKSDDVKRSLSRRTGWLRIAHTICHEDSVIVVGATALGRVWRTSDKTLERLARLRARCFVVLEDQTLVQLTGSPSKAALDRIRSEGRAEYHRRRTLAGVAHVKAAGKWVGRPPFGWTSRAGQLQPHPDDLNTIQQICRRRETGETLKAIGEDLRERGITVHDGSRWTPRKTGSAYRFGVSLGWATPRRAPWDFAKRKISLRK